MRKLRIILGVMSVLVLTGFVWTDGWAQAPNVISYSGTLTDAQGQPTDGPLNLTFRIYDHPVEGPPVRRPLYEQLISNVPVRKGQFTVLLGPLDDNVFVQNGGDRYVEVQVAMESPLLPRQRLTSVPFSQRAARIDSVEGARGGSINGSLSVSGNLGIGTTMPVGKLQISGGNTIVDGNLGIGTTTPAGKLQISGGNTIVDGNLGIGTTMPTGKLQVSGGNAILEGNVGIGTTSPQAKLDVSGDVKASGNFTANGNIGIGIAAPNSKLQVMGAAASTGTGTITSSGTRVTGTDSTFAAQLHVGDTLIVPALPPQSRVVVAISQSDQTLTINRPFGPELRTPTSFSFQPPILRLADGAGNAQVTVTSTGAVGIGVLPGQGTEALGILHVRATDRTAAGIVGDGGTGVVGLSIGTPPGSGVGVSGYVDHPANFAGLFAGQVLVTGVLRSPNKQFQIDHPLDPANKYLYHTSVESPDMKNIYDGVLVLDARGEAWVTLPEWFEALNGDFRYQLTAVGAPGPSLYVAQEIANNRFKIAGGQPGGKVSWQVTGIRKDPYAEKYRSPVEEEKSVADKGHYLHPDVYGQPDTQKVRWLKRRFEQEDKAQ